MWLDPCRYEIVDDAMVEVLRGKTPGQRLAMLDSMQRMARDLIRGKLRQDHPEWSDEQLARETARRMSGGAF
jgi:Rv0078B-related antitoxin